MGEIPEFKTIGDLVLWALALIISAGITYIAKSVRNSGTRGDEQPEPSAERAAVEAGLGISTAGVPDESMRLFARLYNDLADLRAELGLERTYADDLDDMIAGHTSGRYPPWPDKPTRSGSTRA